MKAAARSRRDRIRAQLADLKMPGALEAIDDVLTRVDGGGVTASEAIEQLLGAQITLRNNRRLQAVMRSSRLPAIKTLDDFDFSFQPSIKREQIDSLHELGFLERKENVIFLGPPGVGKTHLAISLAIAAAQSGRRVYYGALAHLITSLEEAKTTGQLGRRLKILTYPSLLVIDEIGYLPVSQTGAMLFFQLINRRYERASTVLTSNKGFEEWGQILGDEVMAAALIDRLLHHCHIVNIRGSSYRMRKHTDLSKILHSPPAESSPSPPEEKESKSKGENDELEARHLRQVCNFRWPDGVNPRGWTVGVGWIDRLRVSGCIHTLEFLRRPVAEGGVQASSIVYLLKEVGESVGWVINRAVVVCEDLLVLQSFEEALDVRVVIGISPPGHRSSDTVGGEA